MVELKNKQLLIDGKPTLIMCGEIHYYRLKKSEWQDRLDKLKMSGCNAVATYIPWLCHEFEQGHIDVTGETREELDITGFLDLCAQNGFYTIVRPGPFIMAEMKNEGIPHWVYTEYPEVIPITWDGREGTTRTLDYLSPRFLEAVEKWYAVIMKVISDRLYDKGGKIISVQLDNEIGMLSWVSNCPDLTDVVLSGLSNWLIETYGADTAGKRYGFDVSDPELCKKHFRSPDEDMVLQLHKDLGYYMRYRFKLYVQKLRQFAENNGVTGVPFIINIHGSGGYRGINYPIGISQLFEAYNDDAFLPGSDYYIGEVDIGNFQDVYLANAFTDCMNTKNQPLASMEFEAGDGNYGDNFDTRNSPAAVNLKTRLFTAQGNRLLNHYLFSGGENYRFDTKLNDGNDRIAFTGEKHGFAAPVGPTGKLNATFYKMSEAIKILMANQDAISIMEEECDNLVFAFIPDYFMTEYHYPSSAKNKEMLEQIKIVRDNGMWSVLAKSLLLTGHRFKAVDIQHKNLVTELPAKPVLVVPVARYLSPEIQQNIIRYIQSGANALIYGELPQFDMEGNSCTLLADFLGVRNIRHYRQQHLYYRSVYPCGFASQHPEITAFEVQTVDVDDASPFLRVYGTDEICGFEKEIGHSKVAVLLTRYHSRLEMMKELFTHLGIRNTLYHDFDNHGILMTSTRNAHGERFIHVFNLDDFDKEFHIYDQGTLLFDKKILLKRRECLMLPVNVKLDDQTRVVCSTAEVYEKAPDAVTFRLTQHFDTIVLDTKKEVVPSEELKITRQDGKTVIEIFSKALLSDYLKINLK